MFRYNWHAVQDNGQVIERWNVDGSENKLTDFAWTTRQFHLFPQSDGTLPTFSIFVPKGAQFRYVKRVHRDTSVSSDGQMGELGDPVDITYLFGWAMPDQEVSQYIFVLPDNRIECSTDWNHTTRFERNIHEEPLSIYERFGRRKKKYPNGELPEDGEVWFDWFADAEVIEPEPAVSSLTYSLPAV